jgi:predicted small lipoprotein YifL
VRDNRALRFGTLIILALSVALAGCGKRNAPTAPPDEPDTYPRQYPSE